MAIRYGCFFSYAHGKHELMNKFKAALADALRCYLEPYFDDAQCARASASPMSHPSGENKRFRPSQKNEAQHGN